MPKSDTFTAPSYETSTFEGETSRWTIPSGSPPGPSRSCAWCSPSAAAATMVSAAASGSGAAGSPVSRACARSSSRRLAPCTYSMAKKGASPSVPTSYTSVTCGWVSVADSRASSRNMRSRSGSSACCGRIFFSTTSFSNPSIPTPGTRARKISAMPPTASRRIGS